VHPARILGDIAADRASDLARRIRRVIEAGVLDGLGDRQIGAAGLGHNASIIAIDLEDAVKLCHAKKDAISER
jgi:hypothetical protein